MHSDSVHRVHSMMGVECFEQEIAVHSGQFFLIGFDVLVLVLV